MIWYLNEFTASANDCTTFAVLCICVEFGQGVVVNDAADHFLADLGFLGVLAPPVFLGVEKSLSQTSHTQRPEEIKQNQVIIKKETNQNTKPHS